VIFITFGFVEIEKRWRNRKRLGHQGHIFDREMETFWCRWQWRSHKVVGAVGAMLC